MPKNDIWQLIIFKQSGSLLNYCQKVKCKHFWSKDTDMACLTVTYFSHMFLYWDSSFTRCSCVHNIFVRLMHFKEFVTHIFWHQNNWLKPNVLLLVLSDSCDTKFDKIIYGTFLNCCPKSATATWGCQPSPC